jgi:hypothetical protein
MAGAGTYLRKSAVAALFVVTACVPHIHDRFDVDSDTGATLDAQQRLVIVTHHGGPNHDETRVCAEPSPDAMSAIAGAIAGKGGDAQITASLSGALSQTAASIGIRTPTIQLLRDGLYRACESYLNDAIDKGEYQVVLRNFDRVMVALLAIDAAGGFPHPPPVTISPGNVTVSDSPSIQGASSPATDGGSAQQPAAGGKNGAKANAAATQQTANAPATNTSAKNSGSSGDITVNGPSSNVTKVDSPTGFQNGDQVIKTVLDYMLDNEKWLTAVCLTEFEDLAKFHKPKPGEPKVEVGDLRYQATVEMMSICDQQLRRNIQFRAPRQYAGDVKAAAPVPPVKKAAPKGAKQAGKKLSPTPVAAPGAVAPPALAPQPAPVGAPQPDEQQRHGGGAAPPH